MLLVHPTRWKSYLATSHTHINRASAKFETLRLESCTCWTPAVFLHSGCELTLRRFQRSSCRRVSALEDSGGQSDNRLNSYVQLKWVGCWFSIAKIMSFFTCDMWWTPFHFCKILSTFLVWLSYKYPRKIHHITLYLNIFFGNGSVHDLNKYRCVSDINAENIKAFLFTYVQTT